MATFTLLVTPDGHALLTTTDDLSEREVERLRDHVHDWQAGTPPILVIPSCEVVQVSTIDIDLDGRAN